MSTPSINKETAISVAIIAVVAVGLIVAVKTIKGVMEAIGLKDDKDEKKDDRKIAGAEQDDWLKPGYFKKGDTLLGGTEAYNLAKQIYDSVGTFYDSPEQMLGALKSVKNRSQASQLANVFQKHFKTDMFGFLKLKMDTDEQKDMLAQGIKHIEGLK